MEVYAHGVGSSCHGDQYHHEVYHLVVGGVTLCGVQVKGRDWWKEHGVYPHSFRREEGSRRPRFGDCMICQRCAKRRWSLNE